MRLSDSTIKILKNFANINENIIIENGNRLRTMSIDRQLYSEAIHSENFPRTFGIYDLNEFLRSLQLFKIPELIFDDDSEYVIINELDDSSSLQPSAKYNFCEISLLENTIKLPPNTVNLTNYIVEFELTFDTIKKLKDACSVYGYDIICITGKDGKLYLTVKDSKNSNSNTFSIELSEQNFDIDFDAHINVRKFQFIDTSYLVRLSVEAAEFTSTDGNLKYIVALEISSKFN